MLTDKQIDALVAEHVMGWGPIAIDRNGNPCGMDPKYPGRFACHIVHGYLTDLIAAFEVIEKVGGYIQYVPEVGWHAELGRHYWTGPTWQSAWKKCVIEYLKSRGVAVE